MADTLPTTDGTAMIDTALTFTNNGQMLHVSLPFVNELISLLSSLSSNFEEDLARISSEQRQAERVDENAPREKKMLVVSAECEEYLRETMWKLRTKEKATYDSLVKKYPGTEAIVGMADPRHNESVILGPRINM